MCGVYNKVPGYEFKEFTFAPILLQAGEQDTYDLHDTCTRLVNSLAEPAGRLVTLKVYADAGHGWDRIEPSMTVDDPFSIWVREGRS